MDDLSVRVAERMAARLGSLADAMMARLDESVEVKEFMRPEWRDATLQIATANLRHEIDALRDGAHLPVSCPDEVTEAARAAVTFGSSPAIIAFCYRTGHATLWEAWSKEVEAIDCPPERRRSLLDFGSEFMFAYADRCTYLAELAFLRERELAAASSERERREAVLHVLGGRAASLAQLGYDVAGHHVAAIAHGPGVDRALDSLAVELGAELLVVHSELPDARWVWFARSDAFGPGERDVLRRAALPGAARLAAGAAAAGVAGFRLTHEQALIAERAAAFGGGSPVSLYEDVALEGVSLGEPGGARAFVATELHGLDGDDERSATLRSTLRAYFRCAQNASSTAARIGVSERTITNRMRSIEERLGHPVLARRAELETALRLRELIRPEVRKPPP